jgi:hypothetical protein
MRLMLALLSLLLLAPGFETNASAEEQSTIARHAQGRHRHRRHHHRHKRGRKHHRRHHRSHEL